MDTAANRDNAIPKDFHHLFQPLQVGKLTVKNRVMITAHTTNFSENGIPSDKDTAYYKERARGGAGLIVLGALRVHPTSLNSPMNIMAFKPEVVPAYRRISDAVHAHGSLLIGQILHMGRQVNPGYSRTPPWAPSPLPCPINKVVPHAMTTDEITELVTHFALAARYAQDGGMDGIEIHGAHGYLIQQFLSPWSNQRTDDYGGSVENRLRFAREVIDAVRAEVGADFTVGMRLSGEEFTEGGLDITQMTGVARALHGTGKLDFLSISQSNYNPHSFQTMIPDMHFPRAPYTYLSAAIKDTVDDCPVFTVGRIVEPGEAETILASGAADMVGMTRAHIADPEIMHKLREGRQDDIRLCISCNQGCADMIHKRNVMSCLQNPAVGFERQRGTHAFDEPVAEPRKVMVIGGGVAGMEAAVIAARRGHHVTLYEREAQLGGQVNTLVRVPERREFYDTVRWRLYMLEKLGVLVHLNTSVTPEAVAEAAPDVVILATGATPVKPTTPGLEPSRAFTVEDVLWNRGDPGAHVLLVDGVRDYRATATAEHLARQGKHVTVITKEENTGIDIPKVNFVGVLERFADLRIRVITRAQVSHVTGKTVHYTQGGFDETLADVDSVVLAYPGKADDGLRDVLAAQVPDVRLVGDCLSPRRALEAIWDGHQAGWAV